MKQQINEIKRMQQLAGIIKEFVDDIHPDDKKSDRIDILLTKYVGDVLGKDYVIDSCIDQKWQAIVDEFMGKNLEDITDNTIKDAIEKANFRECLKSLRKKT